MKAVTDKSGSAVERDNALTNRRALVRLVLAILQIAAATAALCLLAATGINIYTLGAFAVSTTVTSVSLYLFRVRWRARPTRPTSATQE